MWLPKANERKEKETKEGLVAVAIDRDKGSQYALKWAVDRLLSRGQTVVLIHVVHKQSSTQSSWKPFGYTTDPSISSSESHRNQPTEHAEDLFMAFHCFCTRKDIHCHDVTLEDDDIVKAITEYASYAAIEYLILGASSRGFLRKFKSCDIPASVSKTAPDFCTVYVISKGNISSVRKFSRPAPISSPLLSQIQNEVNTNRITQASSRYSLRDERMSSNRFGESVRGRYNRPKETRGENSESGSDVSFASSGRPTIDHIPTSLNNAIQPVRGPFTPRSEQSFGNSNVTEDSSIQDISSTSIDSGRTSVSSDTNDEAEAEMKRLKLELKQTTAMYSTACREALSAKEKAVELGRWRLEEERKLDEARLAEEAAIAVAEKERDKCRAAMEAAEAHQRIAELEAQKRIKAEMKALKEADDMQKVMNTVGRQDLRCRKYFIEDIEVATEYFAASRKIGEGGYGPVFKCYLDNTPVAIKVLRPDAAQGWSQFQQEVEVLSCIRHPNMVLLLGACPEYGCLVYEYMANRSLDDRLFQRGNTPPLSWQQRFRIAAEIATGLLFLHQTKPEPIVHRDLKPGNILLDHNLVSKIGDVGLARLVPAAVADNVTQYLMTSTAGTFCYIDPEYQQTGMLGVKSDVYSLGIMLLQIITAKVPMGLAHNVERSLENGTFADMLDPAVTDWPLEEATSYAKLALQCSELRRKDRPDLGQIVLPELNRLRSLAG